jgi:hypothetical protein
MLEGRRGIIKFGMLEGGRGITTFSELLPIATEGCRARPEGSMVTLVTAIEGNVIDDVHGISRGGSASSGETLFEGWMDSAEHLF